MAARINALRPELKVDLIKGGRGDFIVTLASDARKLVLWDKRRMGDEFPDEHELVDELLAALSV